MFWWEKSIRMYWSVIGRLANISFTLTEKAVHKAFADTCEAEGTKSLLVLVSEVVTEQNPFCGHSCTGLTMAGMSFQCQIHPFWTQNKLFALLWEPTTLVATSRTQRWWGKSLGCGSCPGCSWLMAAPSPHPGAAGSPATSEVRPDTQTRAASSLVLHRGSFKNAYRVFPIDFFSPWSFLIKLLQPQLTLNNFFSFFLVKEILWSGRIKLLFYLKLPSFYSRLKARWRINNAKGGRSGNERNVHALKPMQKRMEAGKTKASPDWSFKSRISSSDDLNHLDSPDMLVSL